jgi:hypothetical protein
MLSVAIKALASLAKTALKTKGNNKNVIPLHYNSS